MSLQNTEKKGDNHGDKNLKKHKLLFSAFTVFLFSVFIPIAVCAVDVDYENLPLDVVKHISKATYWKDILEVWGLPYLVV